MAVMMRSMLEVADNSGARKLQMILPLGGSTGLNAGLGDVITASVKEAAPGPKGRLHSESAEIALRNDYTVLSIEGKSGVRVSRGSA